MRKIKLGTTGIEISRVGAGTWAIGGGGWRYGWGPQDDRQSVAALRRALDCGVNWIDTAPLYGFGRAEEIVGRALKGIAAPPLVATKCGLVWDGKRRMSPCLKKESVLREAEASLKRLRRDVIDLYQIHWPEPDGDIEEAWEAVQELVRAGKVRHGAVANFSVAQLGRLLPPAAAVQAPCSIVRRGIEDALLPYCREHSVGVLAYGALQKGLLGGAFTKERIERLPMDDHRKRDELFSGAPAAAALRLADGLRAVAAGAGITPAQLAVAWALRHDGVTAVIAGVRSAAQAEENARAADVILPPETVAAIEALYGEYAAATGGRR